MKRLLFILLTLMSLIGMAQDHGNTQRKYLALGDSYTIGESVDESDRWPVQLVQRMNEKGWKFAEPKIIATTGWRTDDLKKAIEKDNPTRDYDLVSLLIGVNNQYQGKSVDAYAPEFEELLNMAIAFAGGDKSKVFVVSIPDYGFTPFGKEKQQQITQGVNDFNAVNERITKKAGVRYINITPISRNGFSDPQLVANDGLHPSGKMYRQWVELIESGLSLK